MERFQTSPFLVKNREHLVIHVGSVCLAVISQLISDIFFTLDGCKPNALFQTSSRNVSETFALEVTMDWWSRYYWIIIDFWSMAWLLYAVFSLCKSDIFGAVTLRWIIPVLSFYMLYMSYSNLSKHEAWLAINPGVFTVTRYLTQNGLAAFAWWTLLNALVDLGIVLKYKGGVPDPLISIMVLILVTFSAFTWFILQTFLLNKYLRHTYTVYATLILGLGAMFTRSYRVNDMGANTVYSGCLMLLMTVMSLAHLVLECFQAETSSKPLATDVYLTSEGCSTVCRPEGNQQTQASEVTTVQRALCEI
ncbi:hypothetical protein GBF38_017833 [Nibea albiflora]|uniref:Uncharacterized protein n=1 Tax=Nibea albiflora TaxID=240163 RepID=A0ACB7F5R7_NIBAL|nr:hypothetical protein GBF38_017833 [Nibea albiflora]